MPPLEDLGQAVADTPPLEDLGQAVADTPVGVDRPPVLERYGGCMAKFREVHHHLLCNAFRSPEFHRWGLTWERPTQPIAALFRDFVVKDPRFFASYNVSDATRSSSVDVVQHMCAAFHPTSLPHVSQVARDPTGSSFPDAAWSWRIWFTLQDEMPSAPCTSSCVVLGSSLISDFALTTDWTVTAVTGRPQRLSSSSVCRPN